MRFCSPQKWTQVAYILDRVCSNLSRRDELIETEEDSLSLHFESTVMPDISIMDYLARIHSSIECSNSCSVLAFLYIDRILQKNPGFDLNAKKIHRLVFTATIVAIKYLDDTYANNRTYSILGGIPIDELNLLEVVFISLLEFDLYVHPEIYYGYDQEIAFQYQKLTEEEHGYTMMTNA